MNTRYRLTVLERKIVHDPFVKPIVDPLVLIGFEAVFLIVHEVVLKAILKAILVLRSFIQSPFLFITPIVSIISFFHVSPCSLSPRRDICILQVHLLSLLHASAKSLDFGKAFS
jgi:hypothetical protein